jgi:two-component system, sensor histidine kinase LadS
MSKDDFHNFLFKDSIIWGMIFGILSLLFILLVLFYIIFENKSFLSYLLYILLFSIYLFVDNGFSTLLFGNGELDLILSHLSRYPIILVYILFLDEYLQLSKNKKYPILLKIIYIYSIYLALTSWVIIFSPIIYSFNKLHFMLTLLTFFILLFITIQESIKTKTIPLFYIFGQLSLILGYLFLLLASLQIIPIKASNQQFMGIFVSLEMIFFTIAIFAKMKKVVEMKEKHEKLILSQSHFSTIGQTLKNIAHQWKVPTVRLGTLIAELESIFYKEKMSNNRTDEIFDQMRNSTEFMKNTITEFSNFYSNDNQKVRFKIIDEIDDVKILLIEKMKFLNFEIIYEDIQNDTLLGNPKTFAHICMIIIDNAIDISNKRQIKNPWIKITTQTSKNKLFISFEDNCQGITQKPIESIFELEVSSHEEKNRGIGLSIAKMLTEQKMDGEIHVKNSSNGALFSLILPILEDSTYANNL